MCFNPDTLEVEEEESGVYPWLSNKFKAKTGLREIPSKIGVYVCEFPRMIYVYHLCAQCLWRPEYPLDIPRHHIPWKWRYIQLWAAMWALGIQFKSFRRTDNILHHWAISADPHRFLSASLPSYIIKGKKISQTPRRQAAYILFHRWSWF